MNFRDSENETGSEEELSEETSRFFKKTPINKKQPPSLDLDTTVVCLDSHPSRNVIAAACLDGSIKLIKYDEESSSVLNNALTSFKKSCRGISFSCNGDLLLSASKSKCIKLTDVENCLDKWKQTNAHDASIYSVLMINDILCATGDDDGTVKLWDFRTPKECMLFKDVEEYISCMIVSEGKRNLVCSSGEGTITAYNFRGKRLEVQSEVYQAELTTMALVRDDTKLLVGSSDGIIYIFNWGEFGYHSDKFIGHPESVTCLSTIASHLVISGSEDGMIRCLNVFPHKLVGVVGEHKNFGVDSMCVDHEYQMVMTSSPDNKIRFWNIQDLKDKEITCKSKSNPKFQLKSSNCQNRGEFFQEMVDNE